MAYDAEIKSKTEAASKWTGYIHILNIDDVIMGSQWLERAQDGDMVEVQIVRRGLPGRIVWESANGEGGDMRWDGARNWDGFELRPGDAVEVTFRRYKVFGLFDSFL